MSMATGHMPTPEQRKIAQLEKECAALRAELAALKAQEPVAWAIKNGWALDGVERSEKRARLVADERQKSHDLSGSLAAYRVEPLYACPVPAQSCCCHNCGGLGYRRELDGEPVPCDLCEDRVEEVRSEIEKAIRSHCDGADLWLSANIATKNILAATPKPEETK